MNRSLARSTEHLAPQRRMIVAHAVAAALGGLVPLPFVDEWLPSVARRSMVKRIAAAHGVDLDDDAVRALADGTVAPPSWRNLIGLGSLLRGARRGVRAAFLAYGVYLRADSASRTFAIGTLIDHYCARVHTGVGLDGRAAAEVRARIDQVVAGRAASLGGHAFRAGFRAALRASVRAPVEIFHALTANKLRRLPAAGEVEAEEIVDEAIATARDDGSFLGRTVGAVERQLSDLGGSWVDGLVAAFDATKP